MNNLYIYSTSKHIKLTLCRKVCIWELKFEKYSPNHEGQHMGSNTAAGSGTNRNFTFK